MTSELFALSFHTAVVGILNVKMRHVPKSWQECARALFHRGKVFVGFVSFIVILYVAFVRYCKFKASGIWTVSRFCIQSHLTHSCTCEFFYLKNSTDTSHTYRYVIYFKNFRTNAHDKLAVYSTHENISARPRWSNLTSPFAPLLFITTSWKDSKVSHPYAHPLY